jgi:hypothetical protein
MWGRLEMYVCVLSADRKEQRHEHRLCWICVPCFSFLFNFTKSDAGSMYMFLDVLDGFEEFVDS